MKQQIYTLSVTCPSCNTAGYRESTAPFIYLDAMSIHDYASHTVECPNNDTNEPVAYGVVRNPNVYRQLEGDPQPPQQQGGV